MNISAAQRPLEPMPFAIARRHLSQQVPKEAITSKDLQRFVKPLVQHLAPLASGIEISREQAQQSLRDGQAMLAADVLDLFPNDAQMAHVSRQIAAKALDSHAPAERGDVPRQRG